LNLHVWKGKQNQIEGTTIDYHYSASIDNKRPATDFTPRVIPHIPEVFVPLETDLIFWQH